MECCSKSIESKRSAQQNTRVKSWQTGMGVVDQIYAGVRDLLPLRRLQTGTYDPHQDSLDPGTGSQAKPRRVFCRPLDAAASAVAPGSQSFLPENRPAIPPGKRRADPPGAAVGAASPAQPIGADTRQP